MINVIHYVRACGDSQFLILREKDHLDDVTGVCALDKRIAACSWPYTHLQKLQWCTMHVLSTDSSLPVPILEMDVEDCGCMIYL